MEHIGIYITVFLSLFLIILLLCGSFYQRKLNAKLRRILPLANHNTFTLKKCARAGEGNSGLRIDKIESSITSFANTDFTTRECGKN